VISPPYILTQVVVWFTRAAGAVFVLGGLGFFVAAWTERSLVLVVLGIITGVIGAVLISVAVSQDHRIVYRLLRWTRQR
jgi:glucose uptake protein GlcU